MRFCGDQPHVCSSSSAAGSPLTALEETKLLLIACCETQLMVCKAFWQMSPGNIICHLTAANFMGFVICTMCLEAMVAGLLYCKVFLLKTGRTFMWSCGRELVELLLKLFVFSASCCFLSECIDWIARAGVPPFLGTIGASSQAFHPKARLVFPLSAAVPLLAGSHWGCGDGTTSVGSWCCPIPFHLKRKGSLPRPLGQIPFSNWMLLLSPCSLASV